MQQSPLSTTTTFINHHTHQSPHATITTFNDQTTPNLEAGLAEQVEAAGGMDNVNGIVLDLPFLQYTIEPIEGSPVRRLFATIFALMAFGAEVVRSLEAGYWEIMALGPLWFSIDPGSLNVSQAVIQRYLRPDIWDPGIVTVLTWPTWLVFAIPRVILL